MHYHRLQTIPRHREEETQNINIQLASRKQFKLSKWRLWREALIDGLVPGAYL